jgi:hypothetical protein
MNSLPPRLRYDDGKTTGANVGSSRTRNSAAGLNEYTIAPIVSLRFQASNPQPEGDPNMFTILVVILLLVALGALPTWPHSRDWGYYPSGGLGLVVLVLVILLLLGRI